MYELESWCEPLLADYQRYQSTLKPRSLFSGCSFLQSQHNYDSSFNVLHVQNILSSIYNLIIKQPFSIDTTRLFVVTTNTVQRVIHKYISSIIRLKIRSSCKLLVKHHRPAVFSSISKCLFSYYGTTASSIA